MVFLGYYFRAERRSHRLKAPFRSFNISLSHRSFSFEITVERDDSCMLRTAECLFFSRNPGGTAKLMLLRPLYGDGAFFVRKIRKKEESCVKKRRVALVLGVSLAGIFLAFYLISFFSQIKQITA